MSGATDTLPAAKKCPRITLGHAMQLSIEPIHAAFARAWPNARLRDLLDGTLLQDLEAEGRLGDTMIDRFGRLAEYACATGADASLFTCSAFGPAIDHAATLVPIPVLKPNEAMFQAAIDIGDEIVMLATNATAARSLEREFKAHALGPGRNVHLNVVVVPEAMEALRQGDADRHNMLLARRAADLACDAIMLAHFSTARAARTVGYVASVPVLTAPDAAVAALMKHFE
jgi:aspartate/glutamate racemase